MPSFETERRQLTLLFCDVVESTALSERLDPEDWHDLLTSYHRVCRDAIGQYEGHISQFLGDGVMCYFGYPIAHEDDAVRAISAALRIVDRVQLVNQGIGKRLHAEIQVRVGLHTGIVVVGDAGPGGPRDRLAVGETVKLAARIQTFAAPDTVAVSSATASLAGGHFDLEPLEAQTLRGFSRPVNLYRVISATGVRSGFEAVARGRLTPFVGRAAELSRMQTAWTEVEQGQERVLILRGEAGIGKSRIMHHFRQGAFNRGARVLECFCSPLTQATALAPIVGMLDVMVTDRAEGRSNASTRLDALASIVSEHSRLGVDALPLIAAALSIPGADETAIIDLSPVRRRSRTLELLRAWLASSAERQPVALLVEDLHWADPSTLELLDQIVRDRSSGRIMLCVTCRPELRSQWTGEHVQTIELVRLSATEMDAIVRHVAQGRSLPAPVVRKIVERSEGVPLFVEEVTKSVLESGALGLENDGYALLRPLDEHFLPPTVQGSLVARFDRLGESRGVAQLGAAIGREFGYGLVHAVARMPDAELLKHLDRLGRSELVLVHGDPPNSRYIFKHALIQDAIYATLLKTERARVHESIFSALVEHFPELIAERPEIAAYHAEHAGRRDAAVPLLQRAGARALARTALAEAVRHLAHGIELVGALGEPERTAMEIDLQAAIGPAYMATVGWAAPEVERSCERLKELAAAANDPKVFQAMWGLWTVHFLRGQLDLALEGAQRVLQMALQAADPVLLVAGHHAVGYTHFYRGEYPQAISHADRGLAHFDLEREKSLAAVFQLSSSCALWCFRAQAQQMLGQLAESAQSIRRCRDLDASLEHLPSRAYLLCLCYCYRMMDQTSLVTDWANEIRELSAAEGFSFWGLVADILLAWAGAHRGGDAMAAAEQISEARTLVHKGLTFLVVPEYASMHAESLLLAGQPQLADSVAREALDIARKGKQRHGEPELLRLRGNAARALGDHAQAVEFYRQAIESARSMGARLLEVRSVVAVLRLVNDAKLHNELRSLLDSFTGGEDQPDLQAALALLENASKA